MKRKADGKEKEEEKKEERCKDVKRERTADEKEKKER